MRFLATLLLVIFLAFFSSSSQAQSRVEIVAVVNGESITNYDLQDRIRLTLRSSGLQDSSDIRSKLKLATLQTLINEILQRQEAQHQNIEVNPSDLQRAFAELEKKNNIPTGQFEKVLEQQGVKKDVVVKQIKSQLLWRKVLARKFPNASAVSESEVQEAMGQLEDTPEKVAYHLAEIALPKMAEGNSDNKPLAKKLVDELRAGADFAKVAEQFSASSTASKGGDVGWLNERQLNVKIKNIIANVSEGNVTDPIATEDGYLIFKVLEKQVKGGKPNTDKAREAVALRKMELDARQYLQELREKAFIEVRI